MRSPLNLFSAVVALTKRVALLETGSVGARNPSAAEVQTYAGGTLFTASVTKANTLMKVTTASSNATLVLPAASSATAGYRVTVLHVNGSFTITVQTVSASNVTIPSGTAGLNYSFISDGTAWYRVS